MWPSCDFRIIAWVNYLGNRQKKNVGELHLLILEHLKQFEWSLLLKKKKKKINSFPMIPQFILFYFKETYTNERYRRAG